MRTLYDFPYRKVLVLGLAKSGTAVAQLLNRNDIEVVANDLKATEDSENVKQLKELNIPVITGSHPLTLLNDVDAVIKNPGIPYENRLVEHAAEKSIPILTEVELLHYFDLDHLIGITGSNGKTTTTTLIHEFFKQARLPVRLAGNIGHVASEVAETMEENEKMVVELSSFQLMGTEKFSPDIAVLLNIFEAHLDYHHTMGNYQKAKANIFKNQTPNDLLIYNADDERVASMVKTANATLIPFSVKAPKPDGAFCDDTYVYYKNEKVINLADIALVGKHNLENILAAISVAKSGNVSNQVIARVLNTFTGVRHRLQFVAEVNNRKFYNDSKATNILATTKALSAFNQPIILLAGGLDRGNSFDDLQDSFKNVKALVLFGETADKLQEVGKRAGISKIEQATTMEGAVQTAYKLSEEEDIVLLSPACASWDQYKTFEERGNMFMEAVHRL